MTLPRAAFLLLSNDAGLHAQFQHLAAQSNHPAIDVISQPIADAIADRVALLNPHIIFMDSEDGTPHLPELGAHASVPVFLITHAPHPGGAAPSAAWLARTELSVPTFECLARLALAQHAEPPESGKAFTSAMTQLAHAFRDLDPDDVDKNITLVLGALTRITGGDRAAIFLFNDTNQPARMSHAWDPTATLPSDDTPSLDCAATQWLLRQTHGGREIVLPAIDALPAEAAAAACWMKARGTHAALVTPLVSRRKTLGFLVLETLDADRLWPHTTPVLQRVAARIFANALQCRRDGQLLEENENRFHAQFRAMPSPTFTWRRHDARFVLVDFNDAAERFTFGVVRDMVGQTAEDARMDPDIIENLHRCVDECRVIREERWFDFKHRPRRVLLDVAYIPVAPADAMVHMVDVTDARRTEEGLRTNEERFRAIANYTCGWEGWVDASGRHVWLNPGAERITGYSVDEMCATSEFPLPLVDDNDAAMVDAALRAARSGTRGSGLEFRVRRKDGGWIWVSMSWQPIFDTAGKSIGFRYGASDITNRKEDEQRALTLRDYALALLNMPSLDAILRLSLDTAIRITQGDCGGIYLTDPVTGDLVMRCDYGFEPEMAAHLRHVPAGTERARLVMRGKAYYGPLPLDASEDPVPGLSPKIAGVWAVPILHEAQVLGCLNIGSWKSVELAPARRNALETVAAQAGGAIVRIQSEEALRHSESKYRSLVENAWDGICIVRGGMLEYVNPRMAEMFGLPAQTLAGVPLARHMAITDGAIADLGDAQRPTCRQAIITHAAGDIFEAELNVSSVNWNGNPALLLMVWDVTERRRAERLIAEQQVALASSARMSALGMMASGIAHEINNPLAIISGAAEQMDTALRAADITAETLRMHVDRIVRQSSRIAKVVESFKITARDGENDPFQPVPVNELLDDVRDLCQTRFRAHGVTLGIPVVPEETTLECRRAQIAQVLLNLVANAFDAIDIMEDRWIKIDVHTGEQGLELSVTDSGNGMTPEVRARALDAFFTTKGVGKGSGLGLTISKGIVQSHGGILYIDPASTHTRIVMRLPLRRE